MFVGHLALALAGKRAAPSVSLGWLVAAATASDLLWPVFLLLGVERVRIVLGAMAFTPLVFDSYPWSHSLLMGLVWGAVLAGIARWRGIPARAATLLGALVVSHWVLDFVTHAPDMPLWPGPSPRLGLGLWNSIPGTFIVEGTLWAAAIVLYLRTVGTGDRIGQVAFWSFVVICTLMWASGPWSPPPPNPRALAWFALVGWIVVPWAALADRHRR
ncbi:MAG TPA: hypothetical protein VGR38_06480 [Candidatus Polarisedimenticolia bacterium]|jgi:hypothetical protein|nr:hypothetical protein [Candidatus Polarisedimenticolia bacterium]